MKSSLEHVLDKKLITCLLILFWTSVLALTLLGYTKYPGQGYVYIAFSFVGNLLLYSGFRKNAIFFDTFLGIFFWLGFWLKLTLRIAFANGVFHEGVGYFDGSGAAFDRGLLVAVCGFSGFLFASFLREKFFFNYPNKEDISRKGLFNFYLNHRKFIWLGFVVMVVLVAVTNAYLGIYQRGRITQTILPLGLNGIYKWLLLFGLSSFSALIIRFEFEIRGQTVLPVMVLGFLEMLVSNVSLLSRGMVLNGSALLYGTLRILNPGYLRSSLRFFLSAGLIFSVLFILSVYAVNYMRIRVYSDVLHPVAASAESMRGAQHMTTPLFIDRWVGMEGVLAVSSLPNLSWNLWKTALNEKYDENSFSFYDSIIQSYYVKTADTSKHHFISLPGIVAFFFYPGSFLFLFGSMLGVGLAGAVIEVFVFRLGGRNLILCALIAQVIAFRFASFGYVPKQSYLLFGTIVLNILIIYLADKLLTHFYSKSTPVVTA